jgi:hypothetical protein
MRDLVPRARLGFPSELAVGLAVRGDGFGNSLTLALMIGYYLDKFVGAGRIQRRSNLATGHFVRLRIW